MSVKVVFIQFQRRVGEITLLLNQNTLYKNVPSIFPIMGSCTTLLSQQSTMLAAPVLAAISSTDVAASPNQQCLTTPYYDFNISMNNNLSHAVLLPQFGESRESTRIVFSLDSATGNFSPLFKAPDSTCTTSVSLWGDFDIGDDIAAFGFFVGGGNSLLTQQPTLLATSNNLYPSNLANKQAKQLLGKHCTSILSSVTGPTTICSATESVVVAGSFREMNNFNPSCLKPLTEHSSIVIASGQDVVPGTEPNARTFDSENTFFGSPVVDGNTVVFAGTAKPVSGSNIGGVKPDHFGLYTATVNQDKKIRKLVDTKTPVPSGTGNFSAFGYYKGNNGEDLNSAYYSLSGNQVAFMGEDAVGKKGLYLSSVTDDSLTKIIASGDSLGNGRVVGEAVINNDSLHDNQLLFAASFGGKGVGIYLANLSTNVNSDPQNCLMNWAEGTYPSLFSPAASTKTLAPYTYRYYKNTNAYLGISSADNHVYYLGADGVLKDAGGLSGWLATAKCQ